MAAGQAAATLHSMGVLQAYQAELLKELDKGEGLTPEAVKEPRRATDLVLRATKPKAQTVGRSMADLVSVEMQPLAHSHRHKRKGQNFSLRRLHLKRWPVWSFSQHIGGKVSGSETAVGRFSPAHST